jgi:2-polyprenyl-3-methyl-5-hydroxy-6-metoxy-1,4-benzoquinol methylase
MKPPQFSPAWSAEVQALYRHDMQEIWDRTIAPHVWNQYHNQLKYYLEIAGTERKNILDVGCAQGTLALLLAERGHRVTAVDLRPAFLEYAQSRYTHGDIKFIVANVLEDELPDNFDLIFANQIIEHLVYPQKLLTKLRQRLKSGGRLVVTTPNGAYLRNVLPSFRQLGNPKEWEHLQHTADGDGHFYAYLLEELLDIFKSSGFVDVREEFFESPLISGHMKIRYLHPIVPAKVLSLMDRAVLSLPMVNRKLAHQLLVAGVSQ